jgi:flagellar biogenesis protein FliO
MLLKKRLFYVFVSICSLMTHCVMAADTPPQLPPSPPVIAPPGLDTHPESSPAQMTASYEGAFIKMILTLGGLVLVVFLTIWVLRRLGQGRFRSLGANRAIQIIEKRALSPKSILYIVEVGSKQILIVESQFEVRKLTTLDEIETTEES